MKDLTEKQQAILNFIEESIRTQGYPPTIREIGDTFEITAKGAYDHLKAIEKKGYIKCVKNRSRAIELLRTSAGGEPMTLEQTVSVPLVGRVAAGLPILAQENIEEYLAFPRNLVPDGGVFALRVAGDSMIEAGIHNGDIAVIQKADQAENGEIVVALIEDEATLKYFYKEKKRVRLEPANQAYKPIFATDVMIIGKLVGLYRQF
ncbi:MAG: transcriptional repressor LexA [Leptospiraceae bacterium]|nr:transcriptional repressor LexA [Leptospiraceae bacterium]MCB1304275.1 transcriptional repressor LexA [Leptospiraceae bacterium]